VPAKLEEILNKALEKNRKLRYQNAADLRADLQRLRRDTETTGSASARADVASASGNRVRRNRVGALVGVGVVVVVLLLAVGAWLELFAQGACADG